MVLRGGDVTLPPLERYLTWIHDPTPPPSRYHGDLTSPAPSGDHGISLSNQEKMPFASSHENYSRIGVRRGNLGRPPIKIHHPGRLEVDLKCAPTANRNSASREIGSETRPRSTAKDNSSFQEAGSATQPRSTANDNSPLPGNRPGISGSMRSSPVEHPRTFLSSQHPQHPRFWANHNSERRFDPDHPEFRGVYKPAQPSIQQDYTNRFRRDSFSGSGLSSPALQ